MSSRNAVRNSPKAVMSFGAIVVALVAAIGFTGYPSKALAAAVSPVDAIAQFAAPKVAQPQPPAPTKKKAAKKIVAKTAWRTAKVSWYGPGFYGNTMAGGGKLRRTSMVVAHRSMRFGTKIQFSYRGRKVIAVVKDRGPYVGGRAFDLGPGTAKKLKFSGVGKVRWRVVK